MANPTDKTFKLSTKFYQMRKAMSDPEHLKQFKNGEMNRRVLNCKLE